MKETLPKPCEHGRLKRQCNECALQKENDELRAWIYAVKEQAHTYEDTGFDEGMISAIDATPAQSLAELKAEAVRDYEASLSSFAWTAEEYIANQLKEG